MPIHMAHKMVGLLGLVDAYKFGVEWGSGGGGGGGERWWGHSCKPGYYVFRCVFPRPALPSISSSSLEGVEMLTDLKQCAS